MQKDKIIPCPKSGGICYVIEVSPEINNYMSISSGFWTNSLMTKDSQFFQEQVITLPELYKDLAWEDPNTNLIWLPQVINIPNKGMVFADGPDVENWKWAAIKSTEISEEEKHKHPIKGKIGQFHKYKMNMTTLNHLPDFISALSYIGVLPE